MKSIVIDKRFQGPPNSGNGGYVCGVVAGHIDGSAEITLRAPPPLDRPLDVVIGADGAVELREKETLLATGRRAGSLDVGSIPAVTFPEAEEAVGRTTLNERTHPLPMCFGCGIARVHGDGLRIIPGPLGKRHEKPAALASSCDSPRQLRRGRRPCRAGIHMVGAGLSDRICRWRRAASRPRWRREYVAGAHERADRSSASSRRALRDRGMADRQGRPQALCGQRAARSRRKGDGGHPNHLGHRRSGDRDGRRALGDGSFPRKARHHLAGEQGR